MRAYRLIPALLAALLLAAIASCTGRRHIADIEGGRQFTPEARYLSLTAHDGFTLADIRTPWSDSLPVMRLAIIDPGRSAADFEFPADVTVLQAPLQRSVVFSSVHTAAIAELDAIDAVAAVADGSYLAAGDTVARLIADGRIADVGSSMSPMIERVIAADPDAVLVSPYENADPAELRSTGIPVIPMADYLEATPLGRASWLRFIGALYGRRAVADSICDAVARDYTDIASRCAAASSHPTVITELPASGVWYVPAGGSYMAAMLRDAGAVYPWADSEGSGSLPLDEEAAIDRAAGANIWLVKHFGALDSAAIIAAMPHAAAFDAFPASVYVCDTSVKPYYNSIAFHPERILADIAAVLRPGLFPQGPAYFEPLK